MSKASASNDLCGRFLQLDEEDATEIREVTAERIEKLVESTWYEKEEVDTDVLVERLLPHLVERVSEKADEDDYVEVNDFYDAIKHTAALDMVVLIHNHRKI